ncbi:MAG TPA: SMI1/KNR4 family protein [Thermoleophilaceae bacterium]
MSWLTDETLQSLAARAQSLQTDMGWEGFERPPQPRPPVTASALEDAEARLGFRLPPPVRQLYSKVANGGFGPGYGLIGLIDGVRSDLKRDAVEEYLAFRRPDPEDPGYEWPERILPICHWGCAIYSCVDCGDEDAAIIRFDPNVVDADWSIAFAPEGHTLSSWLEAWLRGDELFEPRVI